MVLWGLALNATKIKLDFPCQFEQAKPDRSAVMKSTQNS